MEENNNNKCNTCMEEKENILNCFHTCAYKSCNVCTVKWLKIKNKMPAYQCPLCRQESFYKNIDDSNTKESDKQFSEWCRNNPFVIDEIFKKYLKYDYRILENNDLPELIPLYDNEFIIDNEQYNSDMANIRRHMPNTYETLVEQNRTTQGPMSTLSETLFFTVPDMFENSPYRNPNNT